jgi:predicted DNA-binding transcriptional regulator AlpA
MRILRFNQVFGPGGMIPVQKTVAYDKFIYRPGEPENIPDTNIPKAKPVALTERAVGFIEAEIIAIIEALAKHRETLRAAGAEQRQRLVEARLRGKEEAERKRRAARAPQGRQTRGR